MKTVETYSSMAFSHHERFCLSRMISFRDDNDWCQWEIASCHGFFSLPTLPDRVESSLKLTGGGESYPSGIFWTFLLKNRIAFFSASLSEVPLGILRHVKGGIRAWYSVV